ncbi:MAG TPA: tannase/feruloyl esterase family alpha/beta hydrolase, partial [Vicinamibacterales bacterium]
MSTTRRLTAGLLVGSAWAVIGATLSTDAVLTAASSCEAVASLAFPDAKITAADPVAAGAFSLPGAAAGNAQQNSAFKQLPAFCRVAATLKPSTDSDIKIELWLPASNWNGKFQAVGNGGWAGSINYAAMAEALKRGYATSSTDSGHQGGGGPWMQNPEKLIDFGYRAVHEMAAKSKAVATSYFGKAPRLSYFNGCSGGGRQGLMEAQRFPDDFDGIVAGAPALNTTGRAAFAMWIAQAVHKDEASYIPPSKYSLIHNAVLDACDAADGVKDGVLENPKQCRFDPKVLACTNGDAATCLTAPQVESVRTSYAALTNPRTRQEIFPGLEPGSELGWATFASPQPFGLGAQMYQYMVFKDPNWDYKTLDFDRGVALTDKIENGTINTMDPNLSRFFGRSGKLIHYHGWSDPQIPPMSSVKYYNSVVEKMGGAAKVKDNYRLFMVPGMAHCGGGDGT